MKVYTCTLDTATLTDTLASRRETLPYAIVEQPDALDFPAAEEPLDPQVWPVGRLFGPPAEVRWRPQDTEFLVFWIAPEPPGSAWDMVLDLKGLHDASQSYYLWGPENIQLQHDLDYRSLPAGQGRPQLAVVEYREREDGRLIFTRYVALTREEPYESL